MYDFIYERGRERERELVNRVEVNDRDDCMFYWRESDGVNVVVSSQRHGGVTTTSWSAEFRDFKHFKFYQKCNTLILLCRVFPMIFTK